MTYYSKHLWAALLKTDFRVKGRGRQSSQGGTAVIHARDNAACLTFEQSDYKALVTLPVKWSYS